MAKRRAKSWASSRAVRKSMRGNKSKGTKPERMLIEAAMRDDVLYVDSTNSNALPGSPDLVLGDEYGGRIAVFMDGCYWHSCPVHRSRGIKTNSKFWGSKFSSNMARDLRNNWGLVRLGLRVYRVWECRVKNDLSGVISVLRRATLRCSNPRVVRLAPHDKTGLVLEKRTPW